MSDQFILGLAVGLITIPALVALAFLLFAVWTSRATRQTIDPIGKHEAERAYRGCDITVTEYREPPVITTPGGKS